MESVIWFVTGLWGRILPSPFAKASGDRSASAKASAGQAEAQRAQSQKKMFSLKLLNGA